VTRFSFAQGAEHAAVVARAVADDNARAATVLVSGATGGWAWAINGLFAPTHEKGLDGRVMYGKCGDGSMCIEHYAVKWQVKRVSHKGTDGCIAYVTGGCALEACTSRVWSVGIGKTLEVQPSVKAVTGADAECATSLNLAALKLGAGGVMPLAQFLTRLTALTSLDISRSELWSEGAASVTLALKNLTALTSLNLSGNKLGPGGMTTLCAAVKHLTALTSLDISRSELWSDGAASVTLALTHLSALTSLNLSGNKLGPGGMTTVMGSVTHLMALTSLDLSRNVSSLITRPLQGPHSIWRRQTVIPLLNVGMPQDVKSS
jgi:hypothetical protein